MSNDYSDDGWDIPTSVLAYVAVPSANRGLEGPSFVESSTRSSDLATLSNQFNGSSTGPASSGESRSKANFNSALSISADCAQLGKKTGVGVTPSGFGSVISNNEKSSIVGDRLANKNVSNQLSDDGWGVPNSHSTHVATVYPATAFDGNIESPEYQTDIATDEGFIGQSDFSDDGWEIPTRVSAYVAAAPPPATDRCEKNGSSGKSSGLESATRFGYPSTGCAIRSKSFGPSGFRGAKPSVTSAESGSGYSSDRKSQQDDHCFVDQKIASDDFSEDGWDVPTSVSAYVAAVPSSVTGFTDNSGSSVFGTRSAGNKRSEGSGGVKSLSSCSGFVAPSTRMGITFCGDTVSRGFANSSRTKLSNEPGSDSGASDLALMSSSQDGDGTGDCGCSYCRSGYQSKQCKNNLKSGISLVTQNFIKSERATKHRLFLQLLQIDYDNYTTSEDNKVFEEKTIVFVECKKIADMLAAQISEAGFPCLTIHGDRPQDHREERLRKFTHGNKVILILTAVAERSLDMKGVDHVINYDMPDDIGKYIQRIGRAGDFGVVGRATSLYDVATDNILAGDLARILEQAGQTVPAFLDVRDGRGHGSVDVYSEDW